MSSLGGGLCAKHVLGECGRMRVMRRILPVLIAAVFALTACGGESEPSAEERREQACEAFAALTPGVIETRKDFEILSDPGASNRDQSDALKRQLDRQATGGRDYPYDCDRPSDKALFEELYGTFE